MRMQIPLTALGLALVAGAPAANAQTVITRQIVNQPVETVQTVETVRTVRPAARSVVRRQVITTRRTVVRQRVIPSQTIVARSVTYPQPLYDRVGPAPVMTAPAAYPQPLYDDAAAAYPRPLYDDAAAAYPRPLYDQAAPAYRRPLYDAVIPVADDSAVYATDVAPPVFGPSATQYSFYRYVYEPDRILVIDPNTNIAVQAIPR
jgi:hypothetical protein